MAKRIPLIKFPNRRGPAAAGSSAPMAAAPKATPPPTSSTAAGSASIQPRRPAVSKEEIEAVLLEMFQAAFKKIQEFQEVDF